MPQAVVINLRFCYERFGRYTQWKAEINNALGGFTNVMSLIQFSAEL